ELHDARMDGALAAPAPQLGAGAAHHLSRAVRVQRPGGGRGLLAADAGDGPGAGAGALREARRVRLAARLAVLTAAAAGVLIGCLRVILTADALAMVHGPFAQAFFAFVVALALLTSSAMARPAPALDAVTRGLTVATAALVYLQIVFGALLTHARRLDLHLAG